MDKVWRFINAFIQRNIITVVFSSVQMTRSGLLLKVDQMKRFFKIIMLFTIIGMFTDSWGHITLATNPQGNLVCVLYVPDVMVFFYGARCYMFCSIGLAWCDCKSDKEPFWTVCWQCAKSKHVRCSHCSFSPVVFSKYTYHRGQGDGILKAFKTTEHDD